MAGARHLPVEPVGVGLGPPGRGRGLDGVDVEVDRPRMVGAAVQHRLQRRHLLGGAPLGRLPVRLPVVPGLQVHQRVGEQHLHLDVVRETRGDLGHGLGIGEVERLAVGRRVGAVARGDSLNERALALRAAVAQRHGLGSRGEGGCDRVGLHGIVDVGPEHVGLAPVAHRAGGIGLLRGPEGARRLAVVERVGPAHALVEIGLGGRGAGRDRHAERAEVGAQVGRAFAGRGAGGLGRGDERTRLEEFGLALHLAADLRRDIGRVKKHGSAGCRRGRRQAHR